MRAIRGWQVAEGDVMAVDCMREGCAHRAGLGGGKLRDECGGWRGRLSDPAADGVGDQAMLACEGGGEHSRGAPFGDEALGATSGIWAALSDSSWGRGTDWRQWG